MPVSRPMRPPSWIVLVLTWILLGATLSPVELRGQTWRSVNALGYAGAGTAIAFSLVDVEDCTGRGLGCLLLGLPLTVAAGGTAGMFAGSLIGGGADRRLAAGEPLGDLHVAAVAGGTVLGGATAGFLVGGTVVSRLSPDASRRALWESAMILSGAGAVAGLVYLGGRWDELTAGDAGSVGVTPTFSPDRGPGLAVRVGF